MVSDEFREPPDFVKPLTGIKPWQSLRLGDYRAIVRFKRENRVLQVGAVGHRSSIYDEFPRQCGGFPLGGVPIVKTLVEQCEGLGETMPSSVPIDEPSPSQLYIDASRLRNALEWFDFDDPTYDPIPVLHIEDEFVLSDGHTRAFLAHLAGATTIEIVPDPGQQELNIPLYRECVDWCRNESVTQVADLAGRVVNRDTFLEQWVARCQVSPLYDEG